MNAVQMNGSSQKYNSDNDLFISILLQVFCRKLKEILVKMFTMHFYTCSLFDFQVILILITPKQIVLLGVLQLGQYPLKECFCTLFISKRFIEVA